jgi:hypothetical protein
MNEVGWLKQSLLDAREETKRLPEWVRQVMNAREEYYGPRNSRGDRDTAPSNTNDTEAPTHAANSPQD